ncbi:MAG: alpha-galactosidase [Candidatus Limnocylindrales bacterium]
MPRIVLVGAGSVEFTRNLLGDILSSPVLRSSEIVLHDIDPERLATGERMARWTAAALGAEPTISVHLDRREAFRGADFVINTIQVGGARAVKLDFEVPARFGLHYTIADTIGVGGVFRSLRTIPVVLGIVGDMAEVCPDAWFLNYTNPMATVVRSVAESSGIKTVGLCHSVFWTIDTIAGYLGIPRDEIEAESAGVNHLAFIVRLERRGRDLYPDLRAFVETDAVPPGDRVRAELFRRLGYYPTEASEQAAEYNPWFIGKRDAQGESTKRFHVAIGEYLTRVARNLDEYAETRRKLDAGEPFEIERSGEYAATIAEAMTAGTEARIVGNVINHGGLISNLDEAACVEVPCTVDAQGVHPIAAGALPAQLAAYIRGAVDMQALVMEAALGHDRDAVDFAVMTDPIVQSHLTLDDTWRLTEAMIEAEAEWLPAWLGGGAKGWAQVSNSKREAFRGGARDEPRVTW